MMARSDHALLQAISAALNAQPFAGEIVVGGARMSRDTARALERQMLRLKRHPQ